MDTAVFEKIFWDNRNALIRYCCNFCNNIEVAEDISQEVFIKFQENLTKFVDSNHYKPWLYRVARNLCLNHIRDQKLHGEKEKFVWTKSFFAATTQVYIVDSKKGPATEAIEKEAKNNLLIALEDLPELNRNVILLKYSEELTREEIAESMEISVPKVKYLLSNSLKALRENKKII